MRLGRWAAFAAVLCLIGLFGLAPARAQQLPPHAAPTTTISVGQLPPAVTKANFDVEKETQVYLHKMSEAARSRAAAYGRGRHWLVLFDALYALVVAGLLMWFKISAAMRNIALRLSHTRFWQAPLYAVQVLILAAVLEFPLVFYESFVRPHDYGLSDQSFAGWLSHLGISFGLTLAGMTILLTIFYAIVRGSRRLWWLWATFVSVAALAVMLLIYPVFVAPHINPETAMQPGPLKTRIVSLAKANNIATDQVYVVAAAHQPTPVLADVSGFGGTTRIVLNDGLLKRGNDGEILAATGQAIGRYVLGQRAVLLTWLGLMLLIGLGFVHWGFGMATELFGGDWDVRSIDDPAGLPVLAALFIVFMLIATPLRNTISRTLERQADLFGLNAARQPDGFARLALNLSEARRLDPSGWEQTIFYAQPSARSRIHMAMQWKAEHLRDADIAAAPVSPQ